MPYERHIGVLCYIVISVGCCVVSTRFFLHLQWLHTHISICSRTERTAVLIFWELWQKPLDIFVESVGKHLPAQRHFLGKSRKPSGKLRIFGGLARRYRKSKFNVIRIFRHFSGNNTVRHQIIECDRKLVMFQHNCKSVFCVYTFFKWGQKLKKSVT